MLVVFSDDSKAKLSNDNDLYPLVNKRLNMGKFSNFTTYDEEGELDAAYWTVDGERGDWTTDELVELFAQKCTLVLRCDIVEWRYHEDDEGGLWVFSLYAE